MATTRARLHAPWSASKVQTALRCPREFHYRYVEKLPLPEVMPDTRIGSAIHSALEHTLRGTPYEQAVSDASQKLETTDHDKYQTISTKIPPFLQRVNQFRNTKKNH